MSVFEEAKVKLAVMVSTEGEPRSTYETHAVQVLRQPPLASLHVGRSIFVLGMTRRKKIQRSCVIIRW